VIGVVAGVLALIAVQKYQWYLANRDVIAFCTENKSVIANLKPESISDVNKTRAEIILEKGLEEAKK